MLLLMVVAELPRGFAGSHYVGSNHNGQAEGEPGRRCRSIQVEEMPEAVPVIVRAGRPLSRGASSTHKTGNMVYIMPRNRARSLVQRSRITPPLRGSRREGGARSRAGGGQTPRFLSGYQPFRDVLALKQPPADHGRVRGDAELGQNGGARSVRAGCSTRILRLLIRIPGTASAWIRWSPLHLSRLSSSTCSGNLPRVVSQEAR